MNGMKSLPAALALLLALTACADPGSGLLQDDGGLTGGTGLTGTIRQGPIEPVCREGVPCDGPVAGEFVLREGPRTVARFVSDSTGHYLVYARPGAYQVVPVDPIGLGPQARDVVVGADGLTVQDLDFDTGIR